MFLLWLLFVYLCALRSDAACTSDQFTLDSSCRDCTNCSTVSVISQSAYYLYSNAYKSVIINSVQQMGSASSATDLNQFALLIETYAGVVLTGVNAPTTTPTTLQKQQFIPTQTAPHNGFFTVANNQYIQINMTFINSTNPQNLSAWFTISPSASSAPTSYQSSPCTATQDAVCLPLTECVENQYQSSAPQPDEDRQCAAIVACNSSYYWNGTTDGSQIGNACTSIYDACPKNTQEFFSYNQNGSFVINETEHQTLCTACSPLPSGEPCALRTCDSLNSSTCYKCNTDYYINSTGFCLGIETACGSPSKYFWNGTNDGTEHGSKCAVIECPYGQFWNYDSTDMYPAIGSNISISIGSRCTNCTVIDNCSSSNCSNATNQHCELCDEYFYLSSPTQCNMTKCNAGQYWSGSVSGNATTNYCTDIAGACAPMQYWASEYDGTAVGKDCQPIACSNGQFWNGTTDGNAIGNLCIDINSTCASDQLWNGVTNGTQVGNQCKDCPVVQNCLDRTCTNLVNSTCVNCDQNYLLNTGSNACVANNNGSGGGGGADTQVIIPVVVVVVVVSAIVAGGGGYVYYKRRQRRAKQAREAPQSLEAFLRTDEEWEQETGESHATALAGGVYAVSKAANFDGKNMKGTVEYAAAEYASGEYSSTEYTATEYAGTEYAANEYASSDYAVPEADGLNGYSLGDDAAYDRDEYACPESENKDGMDQDV